MRIFFLSYSYEPGLKADAGGFRKLWELAQAVKNLGHDSHVFYPALHGFSALKDVPSRTYPVLDWPFFRPLTAYVSMLCTAFASARRERPDMIYFRSGLNVLPPWLGKALNAYVVLEVNGDAAEFHGNEGAPRWRSRLIMATERLNVRKSDLVIALTPGLKRMLIDRYNVSEEKITVIPSGTDPSHFTPAAPQAAKTRLGLKPGEPVVGFVGLFYRHQGVHTLIEAASRILEEAPTTRFLLVGDGVMRDQWEKLATQCGVASSMWFTGQIPYQQVPLYLQAMDVIVAPFTADRGETSPFKILDALASGRPIITSDLTSVRLMGEESGAISLVPPETHEALADAVLALVRHPERRQAMGLAGRAFVCQRYSWEQVAKQLMTALPQP